ncbi:MAG: tetratricopeptide repeat protein [Cyanophyceae cyanobacterium]
MNDRIQHFRSMVLGLMISILLVMTGGLSAQAQLDAPSISDHYFESGIRLYQAGQLPEAKRAFEQALLLNPQELDAHNNLGSIKAQLGDPKGALEDFRAELALNPNQTNSPRIFHNIGNSLLALGQPEEAIIAFEAALKRDPNLIESHISLAGALHQLGHDRQAQIQLELALKLEPENPRANHDLAVLERAHFPQKALQRLHLALSVRPHWSEAHNSLALTLIQLEQWDLALSEFRVALLWDPEAKIIQHNLGRLLELLKEERVVYC